MGKLDHGATLALRVDPLGILGHVLSGVTAASPWPQETISAQRTVDGSYQATIDGAPAVVHVEFEAEPSSDSGARAAEHACVLYAALRLRVRVVVFYLHRASDGRRPLDRHTLPIGEEPAAIVFRPVPLWEQDPEVALAGPIGLLPFVPLMRDASLGQVKRAVERIGAAPGLDERTRSDLVAATHLLGSYHFAPAAMAAIIPREVLMQSPAYQALLAEMQAEECVRLRRTIREGLEDQRGPIGADLLAALERANLEVLHRVIRTLMGQGASAALAQVREQLGLNGS
jgi:hypothetical protein